MGEGANGVVYRVYDNQSKTTIVMKQLNKSDIDIDIDAVINEVDILKLLKDDCHPNFLCYVDSLEDDEHYYILTEYLGGYTTLNELIEKGEHQHLNSEQIIALINQLQQGISQLFQHKMSHRDLKPENIMIKVTPLIETKLIDFGSACHILCASESQVGTTLYLAPELLTEQFIKSYDLTFRPKEKLQLSGWQKVDLWSLGATLFEFFLGWPLLEYLID